MCIRFSSFSVCLILLSKDFRSFPLKNPFVSESCFFMEEISCCDCFISCDCFWSLSINIHINDQVFIYGKLAYGLSRFTKLLLSKYQIHPKSVFNLGNSEAAYLCARSDFGVTFSSEEYLKVPFPDEYTRPIICSIENVLWKRPIVLACKSSRLEEPLIQDMASIIRLLFFQTSDC